MSNPMKLSDFIIDAKLRIKDPAHWTTRLYARAKDGHGVPVSSGEAVKFCAVGSCRRQADYPADFIGSDTPYHRAVSLLDNAAYDKFKCTIYEVNDGFGHEAVMACYDTAMDEALAQERGEAS